MVIEGLMCDRRSCRELIIGGGGEEVDGGDIAKVGQRNGGVIHDNVVEVK